MLSFEEDLRQVINRHSAENVSGTPDYILAEYMTNCLETYNEAVSKRAEWRGESVELPALQRGYLPDHKEQKVLSDETFCGS